MLANKLGQQLGRPTKSVAGWMVNKLLSCYNKVLEENAVRLCAIQPDDTVLEVGYGPGLGLEAAVPLVSSSRGKLIGVDYSEYMYKVASKRMKDHISSGKVTLYHGNVEAIPLPDGSVDKVFHCNSYYYWPELRAGTSEMYRVMKPGGRMVTTLRLHGVAYLASKGVLPGENWRPEAFIEALLAAGFTDVRLEDKTDNATTFKAIFATASK